MIQMNNMLLQYISNSDGLTPTIQVEIPTSVGAFGEISSFDQMLGTNDPAYSGSTVISGVYHTHGNNVDATLIPGALTLAKGTYTAVVAAPATIGSTVTATYLVDVVHTWKTVSVAVKAVNAVADAAQAVVAVAKKVVQAVSNTISNAGDTVAGWFGW